MLTVSSYQMFLPLDDTVPVFILVIFFNGQPLVLKGKKVILKHMGFPEKVQKFLQTKRELWDRAWAIILTF